MQVLEYTRVLEYQPLAIQDKRIVQVLGLPSSLDQIETQYAPKLVCSMNMLDA